MFQPSETNAHSTINTNHTSRKIIIFTGWKHNNATENSLMYSWPTNKAHIVNRKSINLNSICKSDHKTYFTHRHGDISFQRSSYCSVNVLIHNFSQGGKRKKEKLIECNMYIFTGLVALLKESCNCSVHSSEHNLWTMQWTVLVPLCKASPQHFLR